MCLRLPSAPSFCWKLKKPLNKTIILGILVNNLRLNCGRRMNFRGLVGGICSKHALNKRCLILVTLLFHFLMASTQSAGQCGRAMRWGVCVLRWHCCLRWLNYWAFQLMCWCVAWIPKQKPSVAQIPSCSSSWREFASCRGLSSKL